MNQHRPVPDGDFRRAEGSGVSRDQEIARTRKPEAAGQRVAVDATDDRLAEASHQREQLDEELAAPVAVEVAHTPVEARAVGACAKNPVAPPSQHDPTPPAFAFPPPNSGPNSPHLPPH